MHRLAFHQDIVGDGVAVGRRLSAAAEQLIGLPVLTVSGTTGPSERPRRRFSSFGRRRSGPVGSATGNARLLM